MSLKEFTLLQTFGAPTQLTLFVKTFTESAGMY
jgi:hypothetical protein